VEYASLIGVKQGFLAQSITEEMSSTQQTSVSAARTFLF